MPTHHQRFDAAAEVTEGHLPIWLVNKPAAQTCRSPLGNLPQHGDGNFEAHAPLILREYPTRLEKRRPCQEPSGTVPRAMHTVNRRKFRCRLLQIKPFYSTFG